MQASKKFLETNKIVPFISFKTQPEHTVTLVADKEDSIDTAEGKVTGMKYLVKENGETKSFFTVAISLIQQLSQYKEGDEVVIKLASKKVDGQFRSTYVVRKAGEVEVSSEDASLDEVAGQAVAEGVPGW